MQNASTVIRPRPSRFQPAVSSPPGDARSWVTRTKLQVAVCAPLQPVHPADLWTFGEALCLLPQRRSHLEVIERAGYAMPVLLQDVGINHGGGQIIMSQQGLNRADVGAALEQVGGKGMAKRMGADTLGQTHAARSGLDRLVDHAGVNMVSAYGAAAGVGWRRILYLHHCRSGKAHYYHIGG